MNTPQQEESRQQSCALGARPAPVHPTGDSFTSHLQPPSSSISPSLLQIFYTGFVMSLAKRAGRCFYPEGSDPALWVCTRIKEAVNGPLLSCHLCSGSTWVKGTWVVVATSPTRAGETRNLLLCMHCVPAWPPKVLRAFRDYSKLFYYFWAIINYISFPDRSQRVTGLVNLVGQEPCYVCTTA